MQDYYGSNPGKSDVENSGKSYFGLRWGITPENNGEVIRFRDSALTEERRKQLVKQTKQEAEEAKISIAMRAVKE
jgi:ribosome recycling factor